MTTSWLVLVANSGDGTISSFSLRDGELQRLTVSGGAPGYTTICVNATRELVYASVKGNDQGITTFALDRSSGRLSKRSHLSLPDGDGTDLLVL